MSEVDNELPETMNPNNFPAKLWRMVNNPDNSAICWDTTGEIVVIYQQLFEELVLSPSYSFKTTRFSSFVRQLNLYGFRKMEVLSSVSTDSYKMKSRERKNSIHHFFNPNFRRDNPALLINLKRLTVHNRAKMARGIDVKRPLPSTSQRDCREGEGFLGRARQMLPSPGYRYVPRRRMTPHDGTPVPPDHVAQRQIVPSIGLPNYGGLSAPLQQGMAFSVIYWTTYYTGIQPQNEPYHPDFYSTVYQHLPLMGVGNYMNGPFPQIGYSSSPYPRNPLDSQSRIAED